MHFILIVLAASFVCGCVNIGIIKFLGFRKFKSLIMLVCSMTICCYIAYIPKFEHIVNGEDASLFFEFLIYALAGALLFTIGMALCFWKLRGDFKLQNSIQTPEFWITTVASIGSVSVLIARHVNLVSVGMESYIFVQGVLLSIIWWAIVRLLLRQFAKNKGVVV